MRMSQPRTLLNICKRFRCKFGRVVLRLPSAQQMWLQTSMPSRRTSMLPKRFAAPWDLRFKFYLAAENTGARTAPQLTGNRGCESRGSTLTRHGNELRKMKAKISRANTRLPRSPASIHSAWGLPWTVVRCAFAGIRNRYTKFTPAPARGSIQTPKKPNAFGVSAEYSKRRKLLTPPLPLELRCGATDGFQRSVDVWLSSLTGEKSRGSFQCRRIGRMRALSNHSCWASASFPH